MAAKGSALVQVIVMGLIMVLIAANLLQWAFGRYQLVARHQYTTAAGGSAEGCIQEYTLQSYDSWSKGNVSLAGNYPCQSGNATIAAARYGPPGNNNYTLTMDAPIGVP